MRRFLIVLAALLIGSCTTTQQHTFSGAFVRPPANSPILVVQPDIQLSIITLGGTEEPREDWSAAARDNIAASMQTYLTAQHHAPQAFDPATAMAGRTGQIIRLHEAVGASIIYFNYLGVSLPTRAENAFEWTLGPGVQELGAQTNARYALFLVARGSYASGERVAAAVGLAILGVGVPLGGQYMFASLVDLQTGNILWFNMASAGPSDDMREPNGAAGLVNAVMASSPLAAEPAARR